ncbi:MAG: hypothetical protein MUF65_06375 [Rubritepida sp.]|nr:hypothetical protein [Rubritepida sp.]
MMGGWKDAERAWESQKRAWKQQKREWKAQRRDGKRGGPWANDAPDRPAEERRGPVFGWRVWLLPLFLWPLLLDIPVELVFGNGRGLTGALLGLGLAWFAAARMARGRPGDLQRGAVLMGVAGGLTAGLAANIFPPVAVAMGFGAWAGTRLLTADLAAHEALAPAPAPAAPPPANDALAAPRAQITRILGAAATLPHATLLIEAAGAMHGVIEDLTLRPARSPQARRFLTVHVDGLARIVDRLEAGAAPPPTLPALLSDLTDSARRLRAELREAESEALDIQVKVLSDRLRQEGL